MQQVSGCGEALLNQTICDGAAQRSNPGIVNSTAQALRSKQCQNSQMTFCCFFFCCICSFLWLCGHASFSRWLIKEISLMFVGKLRLAETGLYWRSEGQISSQHWLLFHAVASSWERQSAAVGFSVVLALLSVSVWGSQSRRSCLTRRQVFPSECKLVPRWLLGRRARHMEVYEHSSRGMTGWLTLLPPIETSVLSICERSLPLFWGVKTIRHLYCPFPG